MRILSLILLAAIPSFFASCGEKESKPANAPPPPAANPANPANWPTTQETDGGAFEVTIQPDGGVIERNKHFGFDVKLKPEDGNAEGISVAVDADMPAHRHGMNTKPEVSATDGGGYRAEGMLFHMGGDWVIKVDVTRGGNTESASFPVSVE